MDFITVQRSIIYTILFLCDIGNLEFVTLQNNIRSYTSFAYCASKVDRHVPYLILDERT